MRPLPARLFCDTSFFYASLDRRDENHERASLLLEGLARRGSVLIATWEIISETVTLLRYRKDYRTAVEFLEKVKPQLKLVPCGDRVHDEAEEIFRSYGKDHRLSFRDAISFVVVTGILGNIPCLSFDDDFRALGLTVLPGSPKE